MLHKLSKQLVNGASEWADVGDFHGTVHWCVLKSHSSWGCMLPNQEAVHSLLGSRVTWRDLSAHADYIRDCILNFSNRYSKTNWLYETDGRKPLLVREFRSDDDPSQKCYIQEVYVRGFCLDTIYRGDKPNSPCVAYKSLIVMPFGDGELPEY